MADDEKAAQMRAYRFPIASPATNRNNSSSDHDDTSSIGSPAPVPGAASATQTSTRITSARPAAAVAVSGQTPVTALASEGLSDPVLHFSSQATAAATVTYSTTNTKSHADLGHRSVSFVIPASQASHHNDARRNFTSAAANAEEKSMGIGATGGHGDGSHAVGGGPRRWWRGSPTSATSDHALPSSLSARAGFGSGGSSFTSERRTASQRNRSGVSFLVDVKTPESGRPTAWGPDAGCGECQGNGRPDVAYYSDVNAETPILGRRSNSTSATSGRRRRSDGGCTDAAVEDEKAAEDYEEGGSITMEDVIKAGPAPYTAATKVSEGDQSIGTQLLALVERTVRQYWRNKLGFLAELIVPLIFIALVIVLDVAFGSEELRVRNPFSGQPFSFQVNAADYLTYLCYNDVDGYPPLGNLAACSTTEDNYDCSGDESGLPVKGFCFKTVFSSPASVVAQFVEALTGPLIAVPLLDSIIAHQWMAKKARLATDSRTRTALVALSSVGLGISSSTRYDSITYSGSLLFAPRDKVPLDLLDFFNSRSQLFQYVSGGIYETVEEARAYIKANGGSLESNTSIWGLVIVNDLTDNFDVEIHLHNKAIPALSPTVTLNYRTGFNFDGSDMYLASGFATLQTTLYDYFITTKQNSLTILPLHDPDVAYPMVVSLPTIAGERRYLVHLAGPLIAFITVLAFLYPFSQMTKRVVLEKELRIREAMLIMGLRRTSLWICYFTVSFMQLFLTCILITILLCATVVRRSNPFNVFLMFLVFACTLIPLVGLVSTFFSKARLAALLAPLLYFVLSMLIFAMANARQSVVLGLSIFSPTALAALMSDVMIGEGGSGFGSHDLRGNPHYRPEPYTVMLMLMGDFFFYTLLMLYLDAVVPQEWGSTRHPLFFILEPYYAIQKRCARGKHGTRQARDSDGDVDDEQGGHCDRGGDNNSRAYRDGAVPLEPVGERTSSSSSCEDGINKQLRKGDAATATKRDSTRFDPAIGLDSSTGECKPASIRVHKLLKRYKRSGKTFTAVDNISWNLYSGEISVLLGPNGSGKSTTINMMTGMLPADDGDCELGGFSIRDNIGAARHQLGFCPQHNILWPDLTCREHLEFFGKIKGLRGAELEDAVTDVLRAVDLAEKIDHTPPMLSGGQKRKLSVAIAFVGRNRLVLLDEPTAGMDVAARRHTWSLLRAMAANHTILLTTHYMDEADLLGDHIAILSDGVMQCAGSSLFLRAHAGSGYTLRFDLLPLPSVSSASFAGDRAYQLTQKWNKVSQSVLTHVPEACMTLQTDAEMAFCIPRTCELRLPELLRDLERTGNREMGIRSYALSAPTLEDVFLNIIEAAHARKEARTDSGTSTSSVSAVSGGKLVTPLRSTTASHALAEEMTTATMSPDGVTAAGGNQLQRRHTGPQPRSPNGGGGPNPLLLRRMSRASMRFLAGDAFAAAANANASAAARGGTVFQDAIVFREPDEDTTDTSNTSGSSGSDSDSNRDARSGEVAGATVAPAQWGARGPAVFEDDIFGAQMDSPAAGEAPTPSVRRGSRVLPTGRRVSIQVPTTTGRSCREREDEEENRYSDPSGRATSAAAGGEAQSRPLASHTSQQQQLLHASSVKESHPTTHHRDSNDMMDNHSGAGKMVNVGSGEAAGRIRPTWSDVSTVGQPDLTSTADVKRLAAKADQNLEGVWSAQPVKSTTAMWALQIEAMLFKRFWYSLRDRRMQFFQIICPVVCILLAMLLQLVRVQYTDLLLFEAGSLFKSATEFHTSRCTAMFGSEQFVDTVLPPAGTNAVTLTDRNFFVSGDLCDYMIDTWYMHPEPRYAAVQCLDPSLQIVLETLYPSTLAGRVPFVMFYNSSSHHSLPYTMETVYKLLYFNAMSKSGFSLESIRQSRFRIGVKPLPIVEGAQTSDNALASILIGIIVLIPFTFLPANPVAWVVKEREVRARHLQKLSGLPYLLYWAGNMVFDFIAYVTSMLLVIAVFAIFQRWEYVGSEAIGATIVSFILYGLCCCTVSYAVSFLFSEHTTAQVVVMGVSFLTGFVCVVLVFILSMLDWTREASDILRWIFRVLPTYSVGEVILSLALLEQNKLKEPGLTPWSMQVTGWANVYMACEVPVFALITLFWDHPNRSAILQKIKDRVSGSSNPMQVTTSTPSRGHFANGDVATVHSHEILQASQQTYHEPSEDPTAFVRPQENHSPISPLHGGNGGTQERQRERDAQPPRAADAEEGCQRKTALRRQSLRIYPFTDPMAGDRGAFEPTVGAAAEGGRSELRQQESAAVGAPGCSPYGTPGSVVFSQSLSHGDAGIAAVSSSANHGDRHDGEGYKPRKAGIPTLVVDDLAQRRGHTEEIGKTAAGEEAKEVITPGYVVSVPVESSRARRHVSLMNTAAAAQAAYMCAAAAWDSEDDLAKEEEDSDVEDERLAVCHDEKTRSMTDVVRLVHLRKVYANGKVAVRSLSFGIMPGEVFGFLGTNGAGKSTAISILTQEQRPTNGRAYVCGHDVVLDSAKALRCIGYCPQFDACFDLLTVQEHLHFYARIRGIEKTKRHELVGQLMELCDLTIYQDVLSKELSGGNRRKLSVAIALLGAPRVICLDEPSAGMDPIGRRMLWRALDRVSQKCSIVLTTHHLEEVEALADTVAIMVDGSLRCIGDLPHLKHKYARNAYELCIRVGGTRGAPLATEDAVTAAAAAHAAAEDDDQEDPLGRSTGVRSLASRLGVSTASATSLDVVGAHRDDVNSRSGQDTSASISLATPSVYQRKSRARAQSITYGGVDFIDSGNDIVQFMATHLPSAVLIENFNDERYVYSIPATSDVAVVMALLQEDLQRRRSSAGTIRGASLSRGAMSPLAYANGGASPSARVRAAAAKVVRLSEVFRLLQEHRARLGITEYSVSQVSLEQVFLRVANNEGHYEARKRRKQQKANEGKRAESKDDAKTTATVVFDATSSGRADKGGTGADVAASPASRRPSASLRLASFDPTATPAEDVNHNSSSGTISAAAARAQSVQYQRANSLYRALSIHRRASAAAAMQSQRAKGRANANYGSGRHREKSFYGQSAGASRESVVYCAYAEFRRARARQRCRAMEAENASQRLSEPDHESS